MTITVHIAGVRDYDAGPLETGLQAGLAGRVAHLGNEFLAGEVLAPQTTMAGSAIRSTEKVRSAFTCAACGRKTTGVMAALVLLAIEVSVAMTAFGIAGPLVAGIPALTGPTLESADGIGTAFEAGAVHRDTTAFIIAAISFTAFFISFAQKARTTS